ncbi:hypothetical protein CFC21_073384 [Triticum aestivum]|uniref:Uncharacterized protein n=3 Tax=Triticum TaxID=4564 RepID=A0A9R0XGL7_TRITD|nr:hypothetical protein CFC21_073384 [Triticum aestivum]VAI36281.1 unnamed protein product [Triticum turgidum subsp. durum]
MASMRAPQPQAIAKVSISALAISLPIIYLSLLRVPPCALARDSTFWFLMSHSIIAIIAADSGVLFFSSAPHHQYNDDGHDNLSDVVGLQPAATVQEDYCDATSVPLMAPDEPRAPVDISTSVIVGGGDQSSCTGTEGHALALTKGEGAASKPKTDTDHTSVLRKRDDEEETPKPVSANKSDATMVEGDQWATPQAQITVTPDDQDEDSVQEMKPRCLGTEEADKVPPSEEREYWQLSDEELNRKVEEFITRFNRDMVEQEAAVC